MGHTETIILYVSKFSWFGVMFVMSVMFTFQAICVYLFSYTYFYILFRLMMQYFLRTEMLMLS